ncbi:MAG: hypothetical protein J6T10_10690 [Methanobrevibacter sp.]|nr:hypothetical protein [Methanobrevibacter sp.]
MKKEQIRQSFFLIGRSSQELRTLAKEGRIDENQEDLALVFKNMYLKDAVEVVENHRNMKGSKKDLVSFFENNNVTEAVKVSAAVYLCNGTNYELRGETNDEK